jgi:hypothetical protein
MTILASRALREDQREQFQADSRRYEAAAKLAAEHGDMESAARSILALLNCERRHGAQGPQVLQVIKPRSS